MNEMFMSKNKILNFYKLNKIKISHSTRRLNQTLEKWFKDVFPFGKIVLSFNLTVYDKQ